MVYQKPHTNYWRTYQKRLQRDAWRRYYLSRLPLLSIYACGVFIALFIIFYGGSWIFAYLNRTELRSERGRHHEEKRPQKWARRDVTTLTPLMDVSEPSEDESVPEGTIPITASLDLAIYTQSLTSDSD